MPRASPAVKRRAAPRRGYRRQTVGRSPTYGEFVGEALGSEIRATPTTPMARLLSKVESWLYA